MQAAPLTLRDSASISGNTALASGGGVYGWEFELTLNDSASISGNTPDDIHYVPI